MCQAIWFPLVKLNTETIAKPLIEEKALEGAQDTLGSYAHGLFREAFLRAAEYCVDDEGNSNIMSTLGSNASMRTIQHTLNLVTGD